MSRVPVLLRPLARTLAWVVLAMVVHEALAYALAEAGLVARLLSPSPGVLTWAALALLLVLYVVRFGLVFVALPTVLAVVARTAVDLLAAGDPPPPPPAEPAPEMKRRPRA